MVQSVCGKLEAAALGHCQIHEHIWVWPTPMSQKNPALAICDYDKSLQELRSYKRRGGCSIVDAQPVGAGRDARMLNLLSQESGVHIIACTGFHLLGFYPQDSWLHSLGEEELYELYCSELEEGMLPWEENNATRPATRTDIRAGVVKSAIPAEGATGRYDVLLRAAARAAAKTGAPLMMHTESGKNAVEAVKLCISCGMAPEKIVVCHVDRQAADFAPHEAVASLGVYLDYDTVGRFKYHSDADEVTLLQHMLPWSDKLLLALDTTAARLDAYDGEIGLTYIFDSFLPMLRQAGFAEETVCGYIDQNCRQLFAEK